MAVLVAFVLAWETLALDDALDVLDAMLAVIIRDARKIGQKKRLRSLKDLDKSALALASACSYLLKEETPDESIRAEVFSYIPRQKLAEIITLVREIARPSDDNFHDEMVEQYGRVRRFLPHLLNTVKFSSATCRGYHSECLVTTSAGSSAHGGSFLTTHQRKSSVSHGNGW
ncbi:transposase for transposon Tn3 [Klebsiella pneumoniae BIDMC 16]|nr:transposase for transposon Tn3 [Klebsiella pneumoniae BIDMC 16]